MVQPVVRGDIEALLGIVREPKLGHFLVFGLGGVFAEAINDIAMIPVTASTQQIRDALGRPRLGAVLTSSRWRGDRSADQFVTAAVALERFARSHAHILDAVDIKPGSCQ